jgi:hypothetical protein
MNPNIVLSGWQVALMVVVPIVTLTGWLIAVYMAAREPAGQHLAAAGSPAEPATAGTGSLRPAEAGQREPERRPAGRQAA